MNFIDTNILVYAYDKDEKTKNTIAKKILIDCWEKKSGVISTQIIQEFYVTITAKISKKLSIDEARELIKDLLSWPIEQVTLNDVIDATTLQERYGYSFWDSLIIIIAQKSGAEVLYSEDLQNGQKFGDLIIKNPFV
ncbi:MAG TPA: PIN domain-containing protein [Candidatus Saccharimonadia bacterium]|nr:PIN domain-containing protein [Candidatus Saccharimonadia bacterium]